MRNDEMRDMQLISNGGVWSELEIDELSRRRQRGRNQSKRW
ncbi:hypothetical protein LROSL3_1882 [Furfurilactobacillus rossiae]|jgi:hypothetical protein|nr:hypothetical protein [Furfurilactobacillus milii]QLE67231.1 hypothetical protein LROSL2_1881 [Furfurilactobacillus rossiae]QLE69661.1 hypothetical protein LROSL3_1882 [Furfurilactobacillus rossiae]